MGVTEDRAASANGSSDDDLKVTTTFRTSDSSGSFSCWVKLRDDGVDPLFSYDDGTLSNRLTIFTSNAVSANRFRIISDVAGVTDSVEATTTLVVAGSWTHLVVVSSGTAWSMYVNGVAQTLSTISGSNSGDWFADITAATTLRMFENPTGVTVSTCALDEVFVTTTQMTQADVDFVYNSGSGQLYDAIRKHITGVVNYWSISTSHTNVGADRIGGVNFTVGAGLVDVGGIPVATRGDDRAVEFFADTTGGSLRSTANVRSADTSGSISFWAYFDSIGLEPIITKNAGATDRIEFTKTSSEFFSVLSRVASGTANEIRGNTSITTAAWHHFIVVSTGSAWALYVDGTAQTLTTVAGSNTGDWFGDFIGTAWRFGIIQSSTTNMDGRLDEVGIWSTQLTAGNVTTLYNSGTGLLYEQARLIAGLVHYWSCSQNHGDQGADRLGGVAMTVTGIAHDEVGITAGVDYEAYNNQITLGIKNNEGFIELKDDLGNITWRMDDTGMMFEEGTTIVEQADGELLITTAGSDPDFRVQSITVSDALLFDNSIPEWVFFGELGIDNTAGGRITFASNSSITEQSDGEITINTTGTDADFTLSSNTLANTIFYDRSAGTIMFLGTKVRMDSTGAADGGGFTFESGSVLRVTATTGLTTMRSVGTNPDIQWGSGTFNNVLYWDFSATVMHFLLQAEDATVIIAAASAAVGPSGRCTIFQSNTTAAMNTLALFQRDTSEPFIRFESSATAGNTTESIVAQAAVTTATVAGWLRVYVEDDGNQVTDGAKYIPFYTLT